MCARASAQVRVHANSDNSRLLMQGAYSLCVSLLASCHLRWSENVFRAIKLTGETHPAYVLYSVN